MAGDQDKGWKRFQKLRFDRKQAVNRLRKAEAVSIRHAHKFILKRWRNVREVRRIVAIWVVAIGCLIGAAGLQLYWDRQSYEAKAGMQGGTYAEAVIGPVDTLNPLFADSPAEDAASQLIFSRLLTYDRTGHLNYDAARDMHISEDGRTYTVALRPDIYWHDGERMTADDVVFTADLLKHPETRAQIRGWGDVDVTKVDESTIAFTLKAAYTPFKSALTFPILPKHSFDSVEYGGIQEHDFSSKPIGSGPFAFRLLQDTDVADKRIIHLAANKRYYKAPAKLERFQILVAPNEEVMQTALMTNEVNGASGVTQELVHRLPKQRYTVQSQPIEAGVYALLNNDSDILSDVQVRQALRSATDVQEVRKRVGEGVPPLSLPYTSLQVHRDDIPNIPSYDRGAASRLLDKAGWRMTPEGVRKKKGKELRLSVVTTKNADYERALEALMGQWRSIGVRVDERIVDASDPTQSFVQSVLQPRAYDVLVYQLSIGGDPDVFAYWHSSQAVSRGLNLANYSNAIADDILSSARTAENEDLRYAKHVAFAKQWIEDAPAIGLYQAVTRTVVGSGVGGVDGRSVLIAPSSRYGDSPLWTVGDRTVYKTP